MSLPNIDAALLREAAQRLDHAQLGALTCVALRLASGPAHRQELGRQANVPPALLDRIDGWLRTDSQTGIVDGLVVPGIVARRPRGQKQGLLFDEAAVSPILMSSSKTGSLCAATIAAGVRVLGQAGVSEQSARSLFGKLLKDHGFGILAEAIDALEPQLADIANPRGWITGYVGNHAASAAGNPSPGSRVRDNHHAGANVAPAEKIRPLATPAFLGISPAKQRQIQDQNRSILEASKAIYQRASGEK